MRKLCHLITVSLRQLWAYKFRTCITAFGLLLGSSCILISLSLQQSVRASIKRQMKDIGNSTLLINFKLREERHRITSASNFKISKLRELIRRLEPYISSYQVALKTTSFITYPQGKSITVLAISFDTMKLINPHIDGTQPRKIAILGKNLAKELYPNLSTSELAGHKITIAGQAFKIEGVIEKTTGSIELLGLSELDRCAIVPFYYASSVFPMIRDKNLPVSTLIIRLKVKSEELNDILKELNYDKRLVEEALRELEAKNFTINLPLEKVKRSLKLQEDMSTIFMVIAIVSMLVGLISVMNVMLASVYQRIKEIGLRRALGATSLDVLLQFTIESLVLSVLGGIGGVIVGTLALNAMRVSLNWDTSFSLSGAVIAVGISAVAGIIAGIYPAYLAASLEPFEALRYE